MSEFIDRDFLRGDKIDYEKIAEILKDKKLLKAWAELLGVDESDERCIYGWPYDFHYFYEGYKAAQEVGRDEL